MEPDINRRLHLALGKCWHENTRYSIFSGCRIYSYGSCPCGKWYCEAKNPDYCADPRLVIEAMREHCCLLDFLMYAGFFPQDGHADESWLIEYIMDKTGKLTKLATEWLKEQANER